MKKIVILGGGESGVGSAILAQQKGYNVFLSDNGTLKDAHKAELDSLGIDYEESKHSEKKILEADEIIKSPGIPNTVAIICRAVQKNIPVISEIEFAKRYTSAKMICITGSNGKTTTTSLVHHILKEAGLNVAIGGNIGTSFARQVAKHNYDYYVLELSSFQLENMYEFKADIAILLNITPDHLDRYDHDMKNYIAAKLRIIQNQTENDAFIFWKEDPIISAALEQMTTKMKQYTFAESKKNGATAYCENKKIYVETPGSNFTMERDMLSLLGTHNLYNSLASSIAAKLLDISDDNLRKALQSFKGVEHRLEFVAKVRGAKYINDSKATNVNSCWYALKSIPKNIILILGGKDKGNDYTEIESLVKERCKGVIFLGADNTVLNDFFGGKTKILADVSSMKDAVEAAYKCAEEGDTVLLSPCCASFDLFDNYEDRGLQFKNLVKKL